ncbi:MAG: hypothetical protein ACTSO3_01175 [Candidatus Heimdallarchaeaceae archaeon]
MADVLKLSLELKTFELILGDEKCLLKELTGKDRNKYLNTMKSRVKVGEEGKKITINSFDGMQSDLLGKSLFHESGEAFSVEEIENIPSSAQQTLFEEAAKLSGLDEKKDKEKDEDPNV